MGSSHKEVQRGGGQHCACDNVFDYFRLPAPQLRVDVRELGADLLTVVGHKLGAPKGVAALYIRSGVRLARFLHGGGQARICKGLASAYSMPDLLEAYVVCSNPPHHARYFMADPEVHAHRAGPRNPLLFFWASRMHCVKELAAL